MTEDLTPANGTDSAAAEQGVPAARSKEAARAARAFHYDYPEKVLAAVEGEDSPADSDNQAEQGGQAEQDGQAEQGASAGRSTPADPDDAMRSKNVLPRYPDKAVILGQDGRWFAGWALRFIIIAMAGYLLWKILNTVKIGLLPIILAILLTSVLYPFGAFLHQRLRLGRGLAAAAVLLGFFGAISGIIAAIAPSIAEQTGPLVEQAQAGWDRLVEMLAGEPFNVKAETVDSVMGDVTSWLQARSSQIASGVFSGLSAVSTGVVTVVTVLILTFFFLKDGHRFLPLVRSTTGKRAGGHLTEVLTRTWITLGGYIRAQALVSLIDAVFIGIGLVIIGIPMALALAVITFIAGFIPIVGAFSAGALAVIVALVTNGLTAALMVLALVILVQQIEGNVLSPIIQSQAMSLHPAIVLLSVTVGGALFGIIGAFLAVPIAATLAVWMRYHGELVSLRAGEITVHDMELATAEMAKKARKAEKKKKEKQK